MRGASKSFAASRNLLKKIFNFMANRKYYVVWRGHRKGVFDSWEECKAQVDNFSGPLYKSFPTHGEAVEAFKNGPQKPEYKNQQDKSDIPSEPQFKNAWCVDAACSGNPGKMEYRCVALDTKELVFRSKVFPEGTNNIGEFLAIVHALAKLRLQEKNTPVYSDSYNAILWVRNKKCKTKLLPSERNKELFELIGRAETWLQNNAFTNPLVKWETEVWGEIPADFGRK